MLTEEEVAFSCPSPPPYRKGVFYKHLDLFLHVGEVLRSEAGWPSKLAQKAVEDTYRCLVILARLEFVGGDPLSLSLPPALNMVWQQLVLNTQEYQAFCKDLFHEEKILPYTTRFVEDVNDRVLAMRLLFEAIWVPLAMDPQLWAFESEEFLSPNKHGKRKRLQTEERDPEAYQVFVKAINGKTVIPTINNAMPIAGLALLLNAREGYPETDMRFLFAGFQLDFRKCFGDYRITFEECTVHMVMNLRGC